jgi:hypothetical protein
MLDKPTLGFAHKVGLVFVITWFISFDPNPFGRLTFGQWTLGQ